MVAADGATVSQRMHTHEVRLDRRYSCEVYLDDRAPAAPGAAAGAAALPPSTSMPAARRRAFFIAPFAMAGRRVDRNLAETTVALCV